VSIVKGFTDEAIWEAPQRAAFRKALLRWYDAHGRDLPWRRTRDPYAIWLSEIMLQQTQVATVIGYYERFLTAFPKLTDLAAASEQQVLRLWEGLGYYRRARQLHAAARRMAEEHGGEFPRDFEHISALPGIGRYTAGAIASFAFDDRRPIVEANTQRFYSRLIALRDDPRTKASQERLWRFAEEILPLRQPGRLNQALIEAGGQICKPRQPLCESCPVQRYCGAFQLGLVDEIPAAGKPMRYEDALEAAVVVRDAKGRILLRRRGDQERWAGMWDFPRGGLALGAAALDPRSLDLAKVREIVYEQTGATLDKLEERFRIRHGVTRFRIELVCFDAETTSSIHKSEDLCWKAPQELSEVALSVSARKIANHLLREANAASPRRKKRR
jgi:A/G-specific adenine glycosylase